MGNEVESPKILNSLAKLIYIHLRYLRSDSSLCLCVSVVCLFWVISVRVHLIDQILILRLNEPAANAHLRSQLTRGNREVILQ